MCFFIFISSTESQCPALLDYYSVLPVLTLSTMINPKIVFRGDLLKYVLTLPYK